MSALDPPVFARIFKELERCKAAGVGVEIDMNKPIDESLITKSRALRIEHTVIAALEYLVRQQAGEKPSEYVADLLDDLGAIERELLEESRAGTANLAAQIDTVRPQERVAECDRVHQSGFCSICKQWFD